MELALTVFCAKEADDFFNQSLNTHQEKEIQMIKFQRGLIVLTVFLSGMLLFAGCAAQQAKPEQPREQAQCIPEWQINPPSAEGGTVLEKPRAKRSDFKY